MLTFLRGKQYRKQSDYFGLIILTLINKQMKTEFTITKEQILKISYESPLIKEKLNKL